MQNMGAITTPITSSLSNNDHPASITIDPELTLTSSFTPGPLPSYEDMIVISILNLQLQGVNENQIFAYMEGNWSLPASFRTQATQALHTAHMRGRILEQNRLYFVDTLWTGAPTQAIHDTKATRTSTMSYRRPRPVVDEDTAAAVGVDSQETKPSSGEEPKRRGRRRKQSPALPSRRAIPRSTIPTPPHGQPPLPRDESTEGRLRRSILNSLDVIAQQLLTLRGRVIHKEQPITQS